MTRRFILLFCLSLTALLPALPGSAEVFKSVDEFGNVVYTDVPPADDHDATEVQVPEPNRVNIQPPKFIPTPEKKQARGENYTLTITEPADQATIRNPQKPIPVTVSISPDQHKYQLQILYDGTPLKGNEIVDPERGEHSLVARLIDKRGKVIAESPKVVIYVHRPSILQRGQEEVSPEQAEQYADQDSQAETPNPDSPPAAAQPSLAMRLFGLNLFLGRNEPASPASNPAPTSAGDAPLPTDGFAPL